MERVVAPHIQTGTRKKAQQVADRARQIIISEGRVRTGDLANSIQVEQVGRYEFKVGSDLHYAKYQHEGVKGPVRPVRAKVLRFKPKGSNQYVFAKETKGFPGIFFLTRAMRGR